MPLCRLWVKHGPLVHQRLSSYEQIPHRGSESLAERSQNEPGPNAYDEMIVKMSPEARERAAHCGLGQSQSLRGAGDLLRCQQGVQRHE
jgi:hypothetical protein